MQRLCGKNLDLNATLPCFINSHFVIPYFMTATFTDFFHISYQNTMSANIQKMVYINLEQRTDRKKDFENEMHKLGWTADRVAGIYREYPMGILGCGESHLACLKIAKDQNLKNILIMEDDLHFIEEPAVVEEEIKKLFQFRPDFDVCFLSYNLIEGIETEHPFLTRAVCSQSASGYIVNGHYIQKLIDLYEYALPLLEKTKMHWVYANDQAWKDLQKKDNWFCFTKRLGKQRDGFSDNSNRFEQYGC